MPQAWSSEEAPHLREIIGAFWKLWSFAIHQFSRHLLSDEILGRHMSANMSNSGKYVPYICIHSKWRLLPFAHIAPSQLHTDLGHCAKGHDGVYLVFFMLTCIRRTHGQILSTYLYVISLYSSLDLIIFIQHSLGIPSGRWSGVARLGVCPWRRRAKKPRILAGSTDCLGHSWDLRDSDQWPPVPIAIEVKHGKTCLKVWQDIQNIWKIMRLVSRFFLSH